MIEQCCAFTGHRPRKFPWGYNEADARCVALKETLAGEIAKLVDVGYMDFFSGMAEGADTWAALTVLALKKENPALQLHCVLPCEGQADGWSASARERYFSILEQADEVVYVSQEYCEGCMLKRNHYLVDHAACLLAVYNGEWRGGTAMTVRYARKLGREVMVLDPNAVMPTS
ncbi:SLOG family protein [Oscillibacter sp.]|uniref:SLOG family protein n=1 Tax=Oscillibacter sp. TaxID=1945593 RepID=UPI002D80FCBD|nr:SLOG family protein [Oscillibacter sp.]